MLHIEKNIRVMVEDTDHFGNINWRVFCRYCEVGEVGYLRTLNLDPITLHKKYCIYFPRRDAHFKYLAPMEVGDSIEVRTKIADIGKTSLIWNHEVYKGKTLVAKAKIVTVAVDKTKTKVPIPDELRKTLEGSIKKRL
jgi:YbgC/YbaW family acyl-CoA thioester hydrolase